MNPRARGDDDDETSETSASRSDEDAFEDVRATDGFEDEEIDEDEAKHNLTLDEYGQMEEHNARVLLQEEEV